LTPNLLNPFIKFPSAVGPVGGWVELARTTLGSANTTINVGSLPDKRYYQVLVYSTGQSGSADPRYRLNSDTGSNYAHRYSANGNTDVTAVNQTSTFQSSQPGGDHPMFSVAYISNLSSKEKLLVGHSVAPTLDGASEAPARTELSGKWANTSDAISAISAFTGSAVTFNTSGQVVVLGWDPADTHTTNFWEELASVDLSGGPATSLDSGTITAKKYLWLQIFTEQTVDSDYLITYNSDSGSNYAVRRSINGGTDATAVNQASMVYQSSGTNVPVFLNMFIVNTSADEKLAISHFMRQSTAGAGTEPKRVESFNKWTNTAAQITNITVTSGSGNLGSLTEMRIWGSN